MKGYIFVSEDGRYLRHVNADGTYFTFDEKMEKAEIFSEKGFNEMLNYLYKSAFKVEDIFEADMIKINRYFELQIDVCNEIKIG